MVLDASVAVAWYLDPKNATASAILQALEDADAFVPGNFATECINALLKAERRRDYSESQVLLAIEHLRGMRLTTKPPVDFSYHRGR